jgi:hypothetical protein
VLDEGMGVRQALSGNPELEVVDDSNALHLAIQPGVSGRLSGEKLKQKDKIWENSGYGLFITSSLCRQAASFLICSGTKALVLEPDSANFEDTVYKGTALRMVLDTSMISDLDKSLDKIGSEGERLAKGSLIPGNLSASRISRILEE